MVCRVSGGLLLAASCCLNWSLLVSTAYGFFLPRALLLALPRRIRLKVLKKDEELQRAYDRLGMKFNIPPAAPLPPPPPVTEWENIPSLEEVVESLPEEIDTTAELPPIPMNDADVDQALTATTTSGDSNVISETVHRAQEAYQSTLHALNDPPRPPGKAPTFFAFLQETFTPKVREPPPSPPESSFDALANAKEKLGILGQNAKQLLSVDAPPSTDVTTTTAASGDAAASATAAMATTAALGGGLVAFLHSEKAAWCLVVVLFVLAVTQRRAGIELGRWEMEAQVRTAEQQARAAAEAAQKAALGASQAMQYSEQVAAQDAILREQKANMESQLETLLVETEKMRQQLKRKQTKASKAAADEATIQELQAEKAMLQSQLERLAAETTQLRNQLDQLKLKPSPPPKPTTKVTESVEVPSLEPLKKEKEVVVVAVPTETTTSSSAEPLSAAEGRAKKGSKIEKPKGGSSSKKVDEEEPVAVLSSSSREAVLPNVINGEGLASSTPVKTTVATSKKTAKKKDSTSTETAPFYTTPAPAATKKTSTATTATAANIAVADATPEAETTAAKKTSSAATATATAVDTAPAPASTATKRTTATTTAPASPASTAAKKAPTAKKGAKASSSTSSVIELEEDKVVKGSTIIVNEWKELTVASLKRKTVKDLSDYLESKGIPTLDAEGKPLKKSDLVDAVLSL